MKLSSQERKREATHHGLKRERGLSRPRARFLVLSWPRVRFLFFLRLTFHKAGGIIRKDTSYLP